MNGTMVWCTACETVVWAYDHDYGDVRAICNTFRLRCPQCGATAAFDGISVIPNPEVTTQDAWSLMHAYAENERLAWDPSPDNSWPMDARQPLMVEAARELAQAVRAKQDFFGPPCGCPQCALVITKLSLLEGALRAPDAVKEAQEGDGCA